MWYVFYGDLGECWGEYDSYDEALIVCDRLGEDAWICSDDDDWDDDPDLEMGFDPYEGCYSWDC